MKALLYSGGLDSSCLWWILGKPPALFFGGPGGPARDAGIAEATAVHRQWAMCKDFADKLTVMRLDFTPYMRPGQWEFPRDEVSVLAAYGAGFDGVSFGWCKDDGMTEAKALSASRRLRAVVPEKFPFAVEFPAWNLTKAEMIAKALEAGAPREFIEASYSCVTSAEPCGVCLNCGQREAAFV